MYSDLYLKPQQSNPKWPYVVILILALIGFGAGMYYLSPQISVPLPSLAELNPFPQKVVQVERKQVVNMAPYQAGIFWHTEEKETGWVQYGTSKHSLSQKAYDERDTEDNQRQYILHTATLKGLQPQTTYYYKIVTERGVVLGEENEPFEFTTPAPESSVTNRIEPVYGKVSLPKGTAASDAFVFLYYDDIYPLMTRTKESGEWLIPLQTVVRKDTNSQISIGESDRVTLEIYHEDGHFSKVEATAQRASPVSKTISLGKNYVLDSQSGSVLSEVTKRTGPLGGEEISLQHPKEGAVIPAARPLIKGTAIPGSLVRVTIKAGREYTFEVQADAQGRWDVSVPSDLSPGSHLITMQTTDDSQEEQLIRRYFIIAKQGEQVLGDATGSGELSPTTEPEDPTPTDAEDPEETTPTPTDQLDEPTPSPTDEPDEPTAEPTEEEEPTPSPTRRPSPSPTEEPTRTPTPTESVLKPSPTESILKSSPTPTQSQQVTDTLVVEPTEGRPEPPTAGAVGAPFIVMALSIIIIGAGIVFVL